MNSVDIRRTLQLMALFAIFFLQPTFAGNGQSRLATLSLQDGSEISGALTGSRLKFRTSTDSLPIAMDLSIAFEKIARYADDRLELTGIGHVDGSFVGGEFIIASSGGEVRHAAANVASIRLRGEESFGQMAPSDKVDITAHELNEPPGSCDIGTPLGDVTVAGVERAVSFDGSGFDAARTTAATWVEVGDIQYLYYAGVPLGNYQDLGLATSSDGSQTWFKATNVPLVSQSDKPYWATQRLVPIRTTYEDGLFKLWYSGNNANLFTDSNNSHGFGYGTSVDGLTWTLEQDPIRVESGAGEGARLLEVVKLGHAYLAYYYDLTSAQVNGTYLATSTDGVTFAGPNQRISFGDDYRLVAAAARPGDNSCFLGIWKDAVTGSYVATTSTNGQDFEIVSNIAFPTGFAPEDISIEGQDVTFYGALYEGNLNWSYGNYSIATARVSFFAEPDNAQTTIDKIKEALPIAGLSSYIYGCNERCSQYCDRTGLWQPILDSRELSTVEDERLDNTQWNTANSTESVRRKDEDPSKGFHATAFLNAKSNVIAIVYEGTSDLADWKANLGQPFHKPSQYSRAIEFAEKVEKRFCSASKDCESRVVLAGHSLGGGLAQYAAIALGRKAYTFNAAGLWDSTAENVDATIAARAAITHFRSKGYKFGYRLGVDFVPYTGKQFSEETIDIPVNLPVWAWDTITVGVITHNMARLRDNMLALVLADTGKSDIISNDLISASPTDGVQRATALAYSSEEATRQSALNASRRALVREILDAYDNDLRRINLVADHADYAVLAWAADSDSDALELAKERGWTPFQSIANENLTFGAAAAIVFVSDRGDRVVAYSKADLDSKLNMKMLERQGGYYVRNDEIVASRTAGAREVAYDHCDATFVGYALGGHLAQIAHLETGRLAVGFNSAPPDDDEFKVFADATWNLSEALLRFRSPSDPDTSSDATRYLTVANISPAPDGPLSRAVNLDYRRSIAILAQAMQTVRLARDEGWIDAYLSEMADGSNPTRPYGEDATDDEWGPGIVPDSSIDFERNLCAGKEVRSCLEGLGVSEEAIAFSIAATGELTGWSFATEFKELGRVDLARTWNYYSEFETSLLLNGTPTIFLPQGNFDNLQKDFRDSTSQRLFARYPNTTGWFGRVAGHRLMPESGQRFVVTTNLTDFCKACPVVGSAVAFLDFDADGRQLSRRNIGLMDNSSGLFGNNEEWTPALLATDRANLQYRLNLLAYDAGPMDGVAGHRTTKALTAFQREQCLPTTGELDGATLERLSSADAFKAPCAGKPTGPRLNIGNVHDLSVVSGCSCHFSVSTPRRSRSAYVWIEDYKGSAWINIEGTDNRVRSKDLHTTFEISREQARRFYGKGIEIEATYKSTQSCPPEDGECEGSGVDVHLDIKRGARKANVRASGYCGC